jgi:small subunit ribosomal protein S16
MAVTLRMSRKGTKHRPFYHIVATDSRNPRDGSFIEEIGVYDPLGETFLKINEASARKWVAVGATQSATVKKLLKRAGITGAAAPAA